MIKLGVCTEETYAAELAEIGFEYIELNLARLGKMSEEEFAKVKETIDASPIKAEAFNVMMPPGYALTGDAANIDEALEFLAVAYARAKQLGGQVVVFGSGGARRVPEGFPMDKAFDQLVDFLRRVSAMLPEGMTIVVEPLNRGETNIIHSVQEAFELAKAVDRPNIRCLGDLYHMAMEKETMAGILAAGPCLAHTHIANPDGRVYPRPEDEFEYARFFEALKSVGYQGRMSIEGRAPTGIVDDASVAWPVLDALRT